MYTLFITKGEQMALTETNRITWAVEEFDDGWINNDTGKPVTWETVERLGDCHADKCECDKCQETDNDISPTWFYEKWGY